MIYKGKIIKGIGGFYYIKPENADNIIECKARGKFRNISLVPIIGDVVDVEIIGDNKGSIINIYDRNNSFIRPAVANIDIMFIVVSCDNPKPDFAFVDKMISICHLKNVETVICFNKTDLVDEKTIKNFSDIYSQIGYKVLTISNYYDDDYSEILNIISGKTVAFTGFSGVGKSTLMNNILGYDKMETGDVSKKLKRGKHTTRHVELIEFDNNTYIVDTPGFSTLDLPDIKAEELKHCFIEFEKYSDNCKFSDCNHTSGKFCSVCDAVACGEINKTRYNNYLEFYNILKDKKEW